MRMRRGSTSVVRDPSIYRSFSPRAVSLTCPVQSSDAKHREAQEKGKESSLHMQCLDSRRAECFLFWEQRAYSRNNSCQGLGLRAHTYTHLIWGRCVRSSKNATDLRGDA